MDKARLIPETATWARQLMPGKQAAIKSSSRLVALSLSQQ
jgi:hypothetical protein